MYNIYIYYIYIIYILYIYYIYTACRTDVPMGYNYAQKMHSANCSLSLSFPAAHLFAETPSPPPCSWDWVCFSILKASIQLVKLPCIHMHPTIHVHVLDFHQIWDSLWGPALEWKVQNFREPRRRELSLVSNVKRVPKISNSSILIITGRMGIVGTCWNHQKSHDWTDWNILKHKKKEGATPALTLVLICSPSVIPKANKGCLTESPIPCVFIVTNNIIKWQVTTILGVDFSKCSIFAAGLLFTQHQNFQPQPTTAATTRAHCTSCATGGRSQRFNVPQLQTAKRTDPGAWQGTDFPVHGC